MSEPATNAPADGRRKILVVDDAPMFRELEAMFLARSGHVVTAKDGPEALAVARRERPDVIVTDLSMPGMDGDELCARLRTDDDLRHTPVVIVTTSGDGSEHERAVRAGADDVLEKPLNRVDLIQSVNRFLRLAVRGLVRVPMETEVRMAHAGRDVWAWARNLSRGGMFVEAEESLPPETEIALEFALPEMLAPVAPTARVVWRRPSSSTARPGLGLRFLHLDRASARQIDDYVYLRAADAIEPDGDQSPFVAVS